MEGFSIKLEDDVFQFELNSQDGFEETENTIEQFCSIIIKDENIESSFQQNDDCDFNEGDPPPLEPVASVQLKAEEDNPIFLQFEEGVVNHNAAMVSAPSTEIQKVPIKIRGISARRSNSAPTPTSPPPFTTKAAHHRGVHSDPSYFDRRPFVCPLCAKRFAKKDVLKAHLYVHTNVRAYECDTCGSAFKTRSGLNSHTKTHSNERSFKCPHCDAAFKTKKNLSNHKHVHSDERPFRCAKCHMTFKHRHGLNKHLYIHRVSSLECSECGYKAKRSDHVKYHIARNHPYLLPFACTMCDFKCKSKNELKIHNVEHSMHHLSQKLLKTVGGQAEEVKTEQQSLDDEDSGEGRTEVVEQSLVEAAFKMLMKCNKCDFSCSSISDLTNHRKTHVVVKTYQCPHCLFVTKDRKTYFQHSKVHDNLVTYKCMECDYTTKNKYVLNRHKLIHSGKNYACNMCDFRCNRLDNLKAHFLIHSEDRPFKCSDCDYTCKRKFELLKHSTVHLPENLRAEAQSQLKLKRFKCPECGLKCKRRDHFEKYAELKPFCCPDCDFTCKRQDTLRNHQLTHSDLKPLKCTVCEFSCRRKLELRKHIKSHSFVNQM